MHAHLPQSHHRAVERNLDRSVGGTHAHGACIFRSSGESKPATFSSIRLTRAAREYSEILDLVVLVQVATVCMGFTTLAETVELGCHDTVSFLTAEPV